MEGKLKITCDKFTLQYNKTLIRVEAKLSSPGRCYLDYKNYHF